MVTLQGACLWDVGRDREAEFHLFVVGIEYSNVKYCKFELCQAYGKVKGKRPMLLKKCEDLPPVALLHVPTSHLVSGNGYLGKGGIVKPTLFPFYNVEELSCLIWKLNVASDLF